MQGCFSSIASAMVPIALSEEFFGTVEEIGLDQVLVENCEIWIFQMVLQQVLTDVVKYSIVEQTVGKTCQRFHALEHFPSRSVGECEEEHFFGIHAFCPLKTTAMYCSLWSSRSKLIALFEKKRAIQLLAIFILHYFSRILSKLIFRFVLGMQILRKI
jgi:hypothetical protein